MSGAGVTADGEFVLRGMAVRARLGGVPHGELIGAGDSYAFESAGAPVGVSNATAMALEEAGLVVVDTGPGDVALTEDGLRRAEGAPHDG